MEALKTLHLADIADKLEAIDSVITNPVEDQKRSDDYLNNPFVASAAVLVFYDPDTLRPFPPRASLQKSERIRLINELIGSSELVMDLQKAGAKSDISNISYLLKDEVRMQVLNRLVENKEVLSALDENRSEAYLNSPLQKMMTLALTGKLPILESMDLQELNALQRIAEWLNKTSIHIPSGPVILSRIMITELLASFRHLTGKFEEGQFIEYFRGRETELAVLRKYAGVAAPQGMRETIGRYYQEIIEPVFNWESKPPLLVYGLGGVGKSTLLAKFLLDHAEAHEQYKFPFVYLDFDRQILDVLQPETLLIESARQLAIQFSDNVQTYEIFIEFYNKWKDRSVSSTVDHDANTVSIKSISNSINMKSNRDQILIEFANLLQAFSTISKRPFLMVIDTFEEVQFRGGDCVEDLYDYLLNLQKVYPSLRLVLSGRSPVSDLPTQPVELRDLDIKAAAGYLNKYGISSPKTVKKIVSVVGGNPLSLKLAVELVRQFGEEELKELKITGKSFLLFKKRFPDMQVQGILYRRILSHIHNPIIRKLAHPGLVLRVLTSDLIRKVLSEPCQLEITSDASAAELFAEMRKEVSLITIIDNETIRHRPDIRKIMLSLIITAEPKLVKDIRRRALSYYENQHGVAARAEEIYHRLCLDQGYEKLNERWLQGVERYLTGIIDELPSRAQAFLASRTDIALEKSIIWDEQNFEISERRIVRKAVNLLNAGHGDKVLNLFASVKENVDKSGIMILVKVRAQLQMFQVDGASATISEALNTLDDSRLAQGIKDEFLKLQTEILNGNYDKESYNVLPSKPDEQLFLSADLGDWSSSRSKDDDDDISPPLDEFVYTL